MQTGDAAHNRKSRRQNPMNVHQLTPQERFEADLISTVAFHMRMDNPEKSREESLKDVKEDWGAFSDDGRMMARIININQTADQAYMIRAVNVRKLLEIIQKPDDSSFVIRTEGDMHIPENNGTWEVRGADVRPTESVPDLSVSIQTFGQLAAGCVSLSEALYRPDVTLCGNESVLRKVFIRKPILVEDHF